MRRRNSLSLFVLAATVAVADCRSDATVAVPDSPPPETTPLAVARIAIPGNPSIQLYVGATTIVTAVAFDAHGNLLPPPQVKWLSDNPGVATIDSTGRIYANNPGTTVVHALLGKLSAELTVTALFVDFESMALLPEGEFGDTIQLAPGQTLQLSYVRYDRRTSTLTQGSSNTPGSWSSSGPNVATVSGAGFVTAIAPGDTRVTLALDSAADSRVIRVAPTTGTVSLEIIDADQDTPLRLHANHGDSLISLKFGDVHQQTIAAGTLFVSADGMELKSPPFCECFDGQQPLQQFLGFLPPGSKLTLVATHNPLGFTLAPLWGWNNPISSDSSMIRVLWAVSETYTTSYNLYLADVGAPMTLLFLSECYLDWPYDASGYYPRPARPFDIILQSAKFNVGGPEAARFTVTPVPGAAITYILTGSGPSNVNVMAIVDPK